MSRSNWPYSSSITKVNDKETTPNFFTKYVSFRQNIYYNSQIWLTIKIRHSVSYIIRDLLGHRINSLSKHNLDNKLFWTFWTVKFFGTYIARVNFDFNRYRRGVETFPQAKTSKSGHAIFSLFSDASERRVWLSAESKILAFTFERFRLYRLRVSLISLNCFLIQLLVINF